MSDRPKMNDPRGDDPIVRALAGLKPAAPGVDVPVLMYHAGQQSREGDVARWKRACAAVGVVLFATWCGFFLAYDRLAAHAAREARSARPPAAPSDVPATDPNLEMMGRAVVGGPQAESERPPLPPPPAPPASRPPAGPSIAEPSGEVAEYLRVRDAVLDDGLAALPAVDPRPAPISVPEFERSFQLPPGVFTAPRR